MQDWQGKKVVIVGAARQGLALARYLSRHGARVVLTDRRPASELHAAQQEMRHLPVEWQCGGHPLSLLDAADLLCISGGVPLDMPLVVEAKQRGVPLSNDSQIFLEAAPCRVVGITGSAGKTTTTTLVGRIARQAYPAGQLSAGGNLTDQSERQPGVWVGGNIGNPLVDVLDDIRPDDLAVVELSSFQLELMTRSPQVAVILNLTPNHLDRHGAMQAYAAAKAHILQHQSAQDVAVLGRDDPGAWSFHQMVRGRLVTFGLSQPPVDQEGAFLREGYLKMHSLVDGQPQDSLLMPQSAIRLRGEHNLRNVLAACAIAVAAGLPLEAIQAAVQDFRGVPHRLQFVRQWHGADWYNDSIATAPERSIAAIRSFIEPLVLLAGGRDKDLPWDGFAELVTRRVDHLVIFGEAGDKILQAVEGHRHSSGRDWTRPLTCTRCENLREAVRVASALVQPGDVVLLSPGGTSFDEFRDFEERGECFVRWVNELP
jgi:UDP-N-acetylmuramoylalanine--D-glutamate ligase